MSSLNHTSGGMSSDEEDVELYELSLCELIFWCILYAVIALLAVIGNSLVIFITLMRLSTFVEEMVKHMIKIERCLLCRTRAVTTYFIINLAFADLLTGIFAIPFKFQAALFQEWFLPSSLCQIVPYAETVSLSVSVFTLTASAVHEFRTTFFPKHGRMNSGHARSLVLVIWLVAAVVSLPHGLFHRVYLIQDGDIIIAQCRPVYADENWWKIYNVYLTIIHYFVPMIILDTAYSMIAIKLMNMLMIVVACFSLCWFPLETYLLLNEVRPEINGWKYINVLFFCAHWLAMSNSCLNPIIYGLFNVSIPPV
ncbi:unnamed protein product [Heligmosomoides polygyrus]|uniref:G_PROTEIN_RECEP_F1_2 domain-containing protein n=1 Tax=Heligmosomoides polygyrus TaxID=6339 RepID=A0A3P8F1N8_HELPZ|nr:unnamed protein product [Heligmosomoides polygyrus]